MPAAALRHPPPLSVLLPAALLGVLAGLVLAGWLLRWNAPLQASPVYAQTQFNTGLALLLAACALVAQATQRPALARWLATAVALIGGLTLAQDVFGIELGIDRLLLEPHLGRERAHPGRMSPLSSGSLLAAGLVILLSQHGSRRLRGIASVLAAIMLAVALSSLLGYALDQRPLFGWRATTVMALPTASALALLALGLQQALRDTQRRSRTELPTPWWAELLVVVLLLGSLLLWRSLVLAEERRALELQRREVVWLGQRLSTELFGGLLPLRRMAERWEALQGTPEAAWRADARSYLRDMPGLLSVQWLDDSGTVRWVEPAERGPGLVGTRPNSDPARRALLQRARDSGRPALSEPIELLQGGIGLLGFVPLRRDGQDDGHLVGVVRLGELLDRLLAGQVEAASIVLRFEGREVYPHATGAAAPEQADPALRLQLPVFEGDPRWQLVAVLHAAKGSRDSVLPELVLATALALAALLQGAVLLGWSSHQRALALQEARDRLDEAAERVRLATAGARVGIWDWRVDSASLNCDAQTREHLGGASPPTAGGLAALRERVQDPAALAAFIAALERGDNDVTAVLPVRHQDGTELELQFDGHAVRNEAGEMQRIAGVCLDITERRRLERLQREFVATVSHELRTPLTAINGALSLLAAGQLGALRAPADTLVHNAYQNGLRLAALINDLLDWERLSSGGLRLSLTPQPLRPLLEQALALNREYAATLQVQLTLDASDEDLQVAVDASRLQQVLGNLLSNAAKFSPPGGVVQLGARASGATVELWVQDHGPGIPAAFLPRLFEKFSQADASDTRRRGGTGLGLAISRELVQRMGGSIGVDSQQGSGSRFWVRLPLAA
jgi:signal transduction histidine kinase/sensor domain CHASE-containing protein